MATDEGGFVTPMCFSEAYSNNDKERKNKVHHYYVLHVCLCNYFLCTKSSYLLSFSLIIAKGESMLGIVTANSESLKRTIVVVKIIHAWHKPLTLKSNF